MPKTILLTIENNLNLPHAEPVCVNWSRSERNYNSIWDDSEPSIIFFPNKCDIRIHFGASFSANPKGMRQFWINKNDIWNEPFLGYPTPTAMAVADGSSTSFNGISPLVTIEKNSFLKAYAYQTSGDVLSLRGAFATWLEIEVYEEIL